MSLLSRLLGRGAKWVAQRHQARQSGEVSIDIPPEVQPLIAKLSSLTQHTDMPRRVEVCRQALTLVERTRNPSLWAALHAEWAALHADLASSSAESLQEARAENIEVAIAGYEQALQVMTHQAMPVEWAMTMSNLAGAYYSRIRGDKAENIEAAIGACQQALRVRTRKAMPIEWATTMMNLANAYADRIRGDKAENMEVAIDAYKQALRVRTRRAMPFDWAQTMTNLANAYYSRLRGDKAENIEAAIDACQQALRVRSRQAMPVEWATTMNNLAGAYYSRIRGDKAENIEAAIDACQQALQVRTRQAMPVEWAEATINLSLAYANRIRGEKAENLERAIEGYGQALQVQTRQAMPVEWATTMMNLANAYYSRIRGDKAENIEAAIDACQQALQVQTRQAMPVEWATTMMNLANAYGNRIRGDKAENTEIAIAGYEQALQVMTHQAMPFEWAMTMSNLANAYPDRIRGDKAENIEAAIDACQQALQVMTRQAMPVEWAVIMMSLANAYYSRIRGDKVENMEVAIDAYKQALRVRTRRAMPFDWAQTMTNLALTYYSRIRGDKAENIEAAIDACQQALQVMTRQAMPVEWATTQMNLAAAYADRIRGDKAANIERAIEGYEQALQVRTRQAMPADYLRTERALGRVIFDQVRFVESVAHAQAVLSVGEELYEGAPTPEARQALLRDVSDTPQRLAFALCRSDGVRGMELAVAVLEVYRARWLREALETNSQRPAGVTEKLWEEYQANMRTVRELDAELQLFDQTPGRRSFVQLSELLGAARGRVRQSVAAIRAVAPAFLPNPSFEQVQSAAQSGPLVYIIATAAGGLALVVHAGGVETVWLDGLTDARLRERLVGSDIAAGKLGGYLGAYDRWRKDRSNNAVIRKAWHWALNDMTAWLWDVAMAPVVAHLVQSGVGEAVLIPSGLLGLLPLHASWTRQASSPTKRRYALDSVTFRYAPSATALAASQERSQGLSVDGILAVDNPDGSLTFSGQEVTAALGHFVSGHRLHLTGPSATLDAVQSGVASVPVLHFSTHGWAGWGEPLQGGLLLANDATLTLAALLDMKLPDARLAVLSACETGVLGTNLPDEVLGLPAGLLQAGVAGVAASLWAVNDLSTARLMERFYQEWLDEGLTPAAALCRAQRWLRDVTRQELGDYYASSISRMTPAEAHRAHAAIMLGGDPGDRPYSHPYYWAAFTFTGA